MTRELDGVAAQFDELRSRLSEVAGDDPLVQGLLAGLQQTVAHEAEVVEAILDQLPVGVTALDQSLRVVRFNQRAHEITGRMVATATPLCDWPVELFDLDGTPMDFDERPSIRALHGETLRNVEFELRDGERPAYLLNASSTPIRDAGGEVILAVSVFEDVTEGRRRQLADREFVANAAHQIRAPIAGIVSSVGALNAGAKEEPAARDRFLGHIEREVARLQQLAAGLLSLARAERGELPAPLSMIALKPLLQRVIELSPRKDGVDLVLSCPERLSAFTNEALMSEAVTNVVTNAVQHTTHGTVALRGGQRNGGVCIEVTDSGPGVPGLDRDRIFERFFRGSRPAGTGVGLGLAIAAAATHAAGGMLEFVESPVGACFRFTFGGAILA